MASRTCDACGHFCDLAKEEPIIEIRSFRRKYNPGELLLKLCQSCAELILKASRVKRAELLRAEADKLDGYMLTTDPKLTEDEAAANEA